MSGTGPEKGRKSAAYGRVILLLLGSLAVMAAGFFLPSALMDRQREALRNNMGWIVVDENVGTVVTTQAEEAALIPLTMQDLMAAVGLKDHHNNSVFYHDRLEGEMTREQAVAQLGAELRQLASLSLIPEWCADVEGMQYTAVLGTRSYETKNSKELDPRYDVWEIFIYSPELTVNADLHAASGKVISLFVSSGNAQLSRLLAATEAAEADGSTVLEYEREGDTEPDVIRIVENGETKAVIDYADVKHFYSFYEEMQGAVSKKAVDYMERYLRVEPKPELSEQSISEGYAYLFFDTDHNTENINVTSSCYFDGEALCLSYSVF